MAKNITIFSGKEYELIKNLTPGGQSRTYLVKDSQINEKFVIKKFSPNSKQPLTSEQLKNYFERFIREIKILYKTNHKNIVRIFNFGIDEEKNLGDIVMEYIKGKNIIDYLKENKDKINDIFYQAINGFLYLETKSIIHRDIRINNLMVNEEEELKIIDFGFSKIVNSEEVGVDKNSIYLNWPGEKPDDILIESEYTIKTDIYYLGKLFESLGLEEYGFNYNYILEKMIKRNPKARYSSFQEIMNDIEKGENELLLIDFSEEEIKTYQKIDNYILKNINYIKNKVEFVTESKEILNNLRTLIISTKLSGAIPNVSALLKVFINNGFNFNSSEKLKSEDLTKFYYLLSSNSQNYDIVISNIKLSILSLKIIEEPDLPF